MKKYLTRGEVTLNHHQEIFKKYCNGNSIKDLAYEYGLNTQRIRQIVSKEKKIDGRREVSILNEDYVDITKIIVRFNMQEITFENFKDILSNYGAQTNQLQSKVLDIVWYWLSQVNSEELVFINSIEEKAKDIETKISESTTTLNKLNGFIEYKNEVIGDLDNEIKKRNELLIDLSKKGMTKDNILFLETLDKKKEELDKYSEQISQKYKDIMTMETPENRDRVRMAKLFCSSVNVETKYDNTAYIASLGAIMSGSNESLSELERINPQIKGTNK